MMSQPGDQVTGAWGLRAAHADRERAVDVLKGAFVQGRLTKDEFDARVSRALAARTYAELTAITAGPAAAGPVAAGPVTGEAPHQRGRAPTPTDQAVTWSTAATFVAVTLVASMFLLPHYFHLLPSSLLILYFATYFLTLTSQFLL